MEFQGVSKEIEEMLWTILESFTQNERVKYLQFVCGRGKLPINMETMDYKHKITPLHEGGDEAMPLSHTW